MTRTKKKISKTSSINRIDQIHQRLIQNGQKQLAHRILQKSLNHIQNKTQQDPLFIVDKALRNVTPSVAIQTRRIRGSFVPIPKEIPLEKGVSRAIRWIIDAAKKRSRGSFSIHLANEFLEASKKMGSAFQKKQEIQKIASANSGERKKKKIKKKKNK